MNYYYDVLLNFQDKYEYFYEWDKTSDQVRCKKIVITHIDTKTINKLFFNKVKVPLEFLDSIANKCKLKDNSTLSYASIFCDTKNAIVIEFNELGESISKSSLSLDDEINVCEITYSVNKKKVNVEIIEKEEHGDDTKQIDKIKKLILLEINKIYEEKNYSKLKFLFVEWFGYLEEDIEKIVSKMGARLTEGIGEEEYKIYDLIRMSYNNV